MKQKQIIYETKTTLQNAERRMKRLTKRDVGLWLSTRRLAAQNERMAAK